MPRGFVEQGKKGAFIPAFISGEQGCKGQILRRTEEQRQHKGTGEHKKTNFRFWVNRGTSQFYFKGVREQGPLWEALKHENFIIDSQII